MAYGLYGYEDPINRVNPNCLSVDFLKENSDEEIFADEDSWKAAQGLGTAGATIGGLAVLFMFLGFFCNFFAKKMFFKFIFPLMFISAGVCTVLTYIAYDVDMCSDQKDADGNEVEQTCTPSTGSNAAVGSFVLFLIAGISMLCCMTPWEEPMYKFVDELSVEVTEQADKHVEPTEGMHEHVEPQETDNV